MLKVHQFVQNYSVKCADYTIYFSIYYIVIVLFFNLAGPF